MLLKVGRANTARRIHAMDQANPGNDELGLNFANAHVLTNYTNFK